MLTFHFTGADIARVRVASRPDPMWELLLSLHLIRGDDGAVVFGPWKRQVRSRLSAAVNVLFDLAPPRGYSADFLTPDAGGDGLEAGLDALLSTPRRVLRRDIGGLAAARRPGTWIRSLAEGDLDTLSRLDQTLREYFAVALRPYWTRMHTAFDRDRELRMRAVTDGGVDCLLATLHPDLHWHSGLLTMNSACDRDIHLNGRGLLLLPSFFCWRTPITLRHPGRPPVIVHPIAHDLGWAQPNAELLRDPQESLRTLLGRTRADLLTALTMGGGSTGELAQRLVVSPASVSQHTAALRDSGLIVTRRRGPAVHHSATPLGETLVNGRRGIPPVTTG
ncbi:winged helix-turn-helix domain-containing protein [Streptomyces sp. NPDC006335]|uniref:ArsR/SmtB family transcription factor n=1 Tax=Streptomyces sp. NPDC006335 TaxID=3156895 RepID=UPI0033BDC626